MIGRFTKATDWRIDRHGTEDCSLFDCDTRRYGKDGTVPPCCRGYCMEHHVHACLTLRYQKVDTGRQTRL